MNVAGMEKEGGKRKGNGEGIEGVKGKVKVKGGSEGVIQEERVCVWKRLGDELEELKKKKGR